jgi:manganese/zinc/iron transport system substrate-binding protein
MTMQPNRNDRTARAAGVVAALLLVGALSGCGDGDAGSEGDGVLQVVATTGQVGDLVRNIGGARVAVTTLMGPGIDPHLYKASAGDVAKLRAADAIFYNGLHLEAKMGEVLGGMRGRGRSVAVAEAIPAGRLIAPPEFAGAHDPHVWLDVALWRIAATHVRDTLAEIDPTHAILYRDAASAYLARLDSLDAYVRDRLTTVPAARRVLVTAHDAFQYFGRAYGVEVRGLQGISTATEAGTGDVQELAAFIAERRIPSLFVESSVSPRAIAAVRAAVRARGFEVGIGGELFSDALGEAGGPAATYIGMVRHNIDTIVAGLAGS